MSPEFYNYAKHGKPHTIKVDDMVQIKVKTKCHKLELDWSEPIEHVVLHGEIFVRLSNG